MLRPSLILFLALFPFLPQALAQDPIAALPPASRWMDHLQNELLPFWDQPAALGSPLGNFPSTRCNDGSLVNRANPCPEIGNSSYLMENNQYLVPLSRQVYAYCVAFHMTGDTKYLNYARAGIAYLLANAFDPTGGIAEYKDLDANQWLPAAPYRDPQQLAYGLVGMSLYYYLTRDPDILSQIDAVRTYIRDNYWNPDLGAMQWLLQDYQGTSATSLQLVATLDQLNTHMAMIGRFVPGRLGLEWRSDACRYAHSIIDVYYSPPQNLFFLSAGQPSDFDLTQSTTDFGHNSKALWMILNSGRFCGDSELVNFTWKHAPALLMRAWRDQANTWAGNIGPTGIDPTTDWWMHAELDQLSGTLALHDSSYAARLASSYTYWFNNWVDHTYAEVWNTVDTTTNLPTNSNPKQWQWKNGYHSFEHTLVGYITTAALKDNSVPLYFAFENRPDEAMIQPYFFNGTVQSYVEQQSGTETIQRVTFSDVNVNPLGRSGKRPCLEGQPPRGECAPLHGRAPSSAASMPAPPRATAVEPQ